MRRARSPVTPKITSMSAVGAILNLVLQRADRASVHVKKHDGAQELCSPLPDQLEPGIFVDNTNAEFLRFAEFRPRAGTSNDEVRLLRHGRRHLRAKGL